MNADGEVAAAERKVFKRKEGGEQLVILYEGKKCKCCKC